LEAGKMMTVQALLHLILVWMENANLDSLFNLSGYAEESLNIFLRLGWL